VGLSYRALRALGADPEGKLAARFEAFAAGMGERAPLLDDPDDIDWPRWAKREAWLTLHARDDESSASENETEVEATSGARSSARNGAKARDNLEASITELEEQAAACGVKLEVRDPLGSALSGRGGRLEPFGFRDDVSNPVVEGAVKTGRLEGNGKPDGKGGWAPIATGEFLLGYPNEAGEEPIADLPADLRALLENGTFAAFRVLEQHVEQFEKYLAETPLDPQWLAEKMVGRTRDGRPLAAPDARHGNAFDYGADKHGARCPIGAHIRRVNRRDTGRHRLLRRGMPYVHERRGQPPLHGLYFVGLGASIESQFEFLQRSWLNGPVGNRDGERDPIAASGPGKRKMIIEGDPEAEPPRAPVILRNIPEFVTSRGGEYYFMPSLAALRLLSTARS
jgi:Dyp-type peroxidase family